MDRLPLPPTPREALGFSGEFTFSDPKRDPETGEWVVKAWKDGERYPAADYFTDDKEDAWETFRELKKKALEMRLAAAEKPVAFWDKDENLIVQGLTKEQLEKRIEKVIFDPSIYKIKKFGPNSLIVEFNPYLFENTSPEFFSTVIRIVEGD